MTFPCTFSPREPQGTRAKSTLVVRTCFPLCFHDWTSWRTQLHHPTPISLEYWRPFFLSFAQREIHFSDHSDGITSRIFWPQRLLDARNGTGQVLCMFTQLSLLHTGWVVERFHHGRKASVVWGQDPTQLCPVLEHLSLVPDPPLPSAGPTAAVPECNGYCVFGFVGWFGFLFWFGLIWWGGLLFFFLGIYTFPSSFSSP